MGSYLCPNRPLGTVLLHILAAVLMRRAISSKQHSDNTPPSSSSTSHNSLHISQLLPKTRSLYVTCDSPFDEVETFVEECCSAYHLDLVRIGGGMKEALAQYLGSSSITPSSSTIHLDELAPGQHAPGEGIKAILIGTRRGDPHGG